MPQELQAHADCELTVSFDTSNVPEPPNVILFIEAGHKTYQRLIPLKLQESE